MIVEANKGGVTTRMSR